MRLKALAAFVVLVVAACGGSTATQSTAPQASSPAAEPSGSPAAVVPVDLVFVTWDYGIETILDNISKLEAMYPGLTVKHEGFSWFDYHDIIVQREVANTPTDLLYTSDHWIQEWVDAGWLAPLETTCSGIEEYVPEMSTYAAQGAVYQGHTWALPYYAEPFIFMYNEDQLKQVGYTNAPTTWEEVADAARKIKAAGINKYPIVLSLSQSESASIEIFYSIVYSMAADAGSMFDSKNNVTFTAPGGPATYAIDWMRNALLVDKTLDPASLQLGEIDNFAGMKSGSHTFTIQGSHGMGELNKEGSGAYAGKFKQALMPGTSHSTVGFARYYSMSSSVLDKDQAAIDATCNFLHYMGGKTDGQYLVVKRWAIENALGFAQLPLFDDPDVIAAWSPVLDPAMLKEQSRLSRVKEGLTPYFGSWDVFARAELQRAYLGQVSTQEALGNMAAKWEELKP